MSRLPDILNQRYSKKEFSVFLWVLFPYIFIMNWLVYGTCTFGSASIFIKSFLYTCLFFFLCYFIFGMVATFIRYRLPSGGELFKRIGMMLLVFYFMNAAVIYSFFQLNTKFAVVDCTIQMNMMGWAILYGCIASTVITFINEGVANWEKWKASLAERDRLKNAYQRSKLLGLKGQINPHFLFNCFNTLAELITDNEKEAETFLEEMTKVHRYLLRSNDDYLVPVTDEMKFAKSYLFLAKVRFGNAIDYSFNIHGSVLEKLIPPLSMQVILENIIYSNAISKNNPLNIEISVKGDDHLLIQHSLHQKSMNQIFGVDIFEGLDNLVNKYKLLGVDQIIIRENKNQRRIMLPIMDRKPTFA